MSIRDLIKHRVRASVAIFVACFVGGLFANRLLPLGARALVGTVGALVALFAYVWMLLTRCPRCRTLIAMTIALPVALRLFGRKVKYCPYCAVDLDEPVQRIGT